jgi:hypothetical protein
MKFGAEKDHEYTNKFCCNHYCFVWQSFKYGRVRNFEVMLRLNTESFCAEFCNFVHYHIFVNNFLTKAVSLHAMKALWRRGDIAPTHS